MKNLKLIYVRLNAFALKWERRKGCLGLPLLFKMALEFLGIVIRQINNNNDRQTDGKEVKLSLIQRQNDKDIYKTDTRINELRNVTG